MQVDPISISWKTIDVIILRNIMAYDNLPWQVKYVMCVSFGSDIDSD